MNAGNAKQMARRQAVVASIIEFISTHSVATVEQISKHSGWTPGTTKKRLQGMRNAGMIHIGQWLWTDNCSQKVAAYAVGCKPDARQPYGQKRLLAEAREMSLEALATFEVHQRHAKQMKNWKPRRDIAASWF